MDRWSEQPDPQHDRHVAFPGGPATPPPESWWTPLPPPPPPPPQAVRSAAPRRRPRKGAAWWAVVAVFVFGALLSNGGESVSSSGSGGSYADAPAPAGVDLVQEPTAAGGDLEPADAALYGIPRGTLWFRLEVAGADSGATVDVMSASGAHLRTEELGLPYAGRLSRVNPDDGLTVRVYRTHGQKPVQCRVYLDDLVAIGTGPGTATCEVPASR